MTTPTAEIGKWDLEALPDPVVRPSEDGRMPVLIRWGSGSS
jgi:hypothetical protein